MEVILKRVLAGLIHNEKAAEHFLFKDYNCRIFYDVNPRTAEIHIHGVEEAGLLAKWGKLFFQRHAQTMPWSFVLKMIRKRGSDDLSVFKKTWKDLEVHKEIDIGEWKEYLETLITKYREYRHKDVFLMLGKLYEHECIGNYEPGEKCKNCGCANECKKMQRSDIEDKSQYLLDWSASQTEQIKLDTMGTYIRAYEVGKLMSDCLTNLDKDRKMVDENGKRILIGFPTPLQSLTDHIGGWMPGRLYGVGARSGVGKSAFLLQCGNTVAKTGIPVIHFNLEMPVEEELGFRIISYATGISFRDIMKRQVDDDLMEELKKSVKAWSDDLRESKNYRIIDMTRRTPLQTIMRYTDNFMAEKGTHRILVILDFFNLLYVDESSKRADLQWALLSEELHSFARDRRLAVITALQLNRLGDKVRRVTPKHFRDSDKIIDSFDGCWALLKYTENYAKLSPVKGRYFQAKEFPMTMELGKMTFTEYNKTSAEEEGDLDDEGPDQEDGL